MLNLKAALCLGFLAFHVQPQASHFAQPLPPHKSTAQRGSPILSWSYGDTNLLQNGSFEQGFEGWTRTGRTTILQSSTAPHGTNIFRVDTGTLSRRLTLPPDSPGLRWTYQFKPGGKIKTLVLNSDNQLVYEDLLEASANAVGAWPLASLDLGRFSGQTITLSQQFTSYDLGLYILMDDVQLTPVPPGVQFDIYFGIGQQLVYLGRTNHCSWPLTNLLPNKTWQWRVDAVTATSTNSSPLWQFTTSFALNETLSVGFSPVPSAVCASEPFPLTVFLVDGWDFVYPFPRFPVLLTASAENARPASVLITEVDMGLNDSVEFLNASSSPLHLSNWFVQLLDSFSSSTPSHTIKLPVDSQLQPGEIFTLRESAPGAWPNLRIGPALSWGDSSSKFVGGVILRDPQSNVVDCVFIDPRPESTIGFGWQVRTVPSLEWFSPPVQTFDPAKSFQRVGQSDLNRASDWVLQTPNMASVNSGLALPFNLGFGAIPITPNSISNFVSGRAANLFSFSSPASNVIITAAYSAPRSTVIGATSPFQVLPSNLCANLSSPLSISESQGTFPLRLVLSSPAPQDIVVPVRTSDPRRILLPQSLLVPAGTIDISFEIPVYDDSFLALPSEIFIYADPPGFSSTTCSLLLEDDEKPALEITGPRTIVEGSPVDFVITCTPTPVTDIPLKFSSSPQLFYDWTARLPAGTNKLVVSLGFEDFYLQRSGESRLSVSAPGAPPAIFDIFYTDNESTNLSLQILASSVEGETATLFVGTSSVHFLPLEINLTSSNPEILTLPAQIVRPASFVDSMAEIQFTENQDRTGARAVTITASAEGWIPASLTLNVQDNDPGKVLLRSTPGPWIVSNAVPIQALAATMDDILLPALDLSAATYSVSDGSSQLPFRISPTPDSPGSFTLFVDSPSTGAVVRAELSSISGELSPIPVWTQSVSGLNHALFDPLRDQFIIAPHDANVVYLDFPTGTRHAFVSSITGAEFLALSEDNNFLFGILTPGDRLFRSDLSKRTLADMWFVGMEAESPLNASVILPIPGRNDSVAALRGFFEQRDSRDLAIFAAPGLVSRQPLQVQASSSIAFSTTLRQFYVADPSALSTIPLSDDHTLADPALRQLAYMWDRFPLPNDTAFGHNLFFTPHGILFDPDVPGFLTDAPLEFDNTAVSFHPGFQRFGFLVRSNNLVSEFRVFSPLTFQLEQTIPLLGVRNDYWRLFPAGKHGWGLLTGGDFHVIPWTPPIQTAQTELKISGIAFTLPSAPRVLNAQITIANESDTPAHEVVLALVLPADAMLLQLPDFPPGPARLRHPFLVGDIPPHTSRQVSLTLTGNKTGSLKLSAFTAAKTSESNLSDNRILLEGSISLETPPPQPLLTALPLPDGWNLKLSFSSQPGWTYSLYRSADLSNPVWSHVLNLQATNTSAEFIVDLSDQASFFQVTVSP